MSSWLSLNPFKAQQQQESEEEEEDEEEDHLNPNSNGAASVQEDLSELGKTLTRQLWGVASFLAPPPPPSSTTPTTSQTFLGIRNDFAEISGSLKSGFSLISTNKAVNEISKLASNLLQFDGGDDDNDDQAEDSGSGVAGVTDEALEFVREISLRPECWIDFPLSLDTYDFHMSNAQKEHALTVEQLAPSLADLKAKLCHSRMREEYFWMIYFILLHPRLDKQDSELLSMAQIAEARDLLLKTVQSRTNAHLPPSKADNLPLEVHKGNNVQEECSKIQEKEVLAETVSSEPEEANVDKWLEEDVETGTSLNGQNQFGNEQDVSFSDLEDDDSDTSSQQGRTSSAPNVRFSSPNDKSGWVHLSENSDTKGGRRKIVQPASRDKDSENEESNDWLTIDEFDSYSVGTP